MEKEWVLCLLLLLGAAIIFWWVFDEPGDEDFYCHAELHNGIGKCKHVCRYCKKRRNK